ncbi:helix-turn-helix domain-containing protein [Glycomyces artemisiae]|uniref:DNA-binding XRE family transcriptional regulator n=1 Tax=Glycomyces artemisiae TaxID=1076443 RepID=A0A2T0UPG3_9ACTN|nr:helix-turn-helix domain-containing protein [Glycomyces artemisiae]PRY59829.1 DNA-binding XRE family transcriptional regulator [Glycomyces artemisiae]
MPEAHVNLRPLRLRAMMSQEELALKAGVGTRTVRDIESGRVRPQPKTLRLIADALGLDEAGLAELNGEPAAAAAPAPVTLPSATAVFTGRTAALAALDAAPPLVVLSGVGGVGKTMLALHWGHRAAERFPGGRLYIDLRGFGPDGTAMEPDEAVRHLLASLGVEQRRLPADPEAQIALYRSVMGAGRRLLVLDNARDAAQVRPLLPDPAQVRTVVVSRRRLVGLAASHGAAVVEVEAFDSDEAAELLERQLGAARVAAEPEAAQRIADLCTGLPLALAITGARAAAAPGLTLSAVADELERSRLDALAVDEDSVDLRAVFSWSYRALDPEAARLFRLLSLIPGPDFEPDAAAALHGGPAAAKAFRSLVEGHLVEPDGRGRFRLHDLLRLYAAELLEAEAPQPERDAALDRLLDWYLQSAGACRAALYPAMVGLALPPALHEWPAPQDPAQWLASEWKNLCAIVGYAAAQGRAPFTWLMSDVLRGYAWLHMLGADSARLDRTALAAATAAGDPLGRAAASMALGCSLLRLTDYDEAIGHLRDAASLARQADWPAAVASAEGNLAVACYHRGRMREGLEHAYAALHAFREIGEQRAESTNLHWLGLFHSLLGELDTGVGFLEQALKLTTAAGNATISVTLLGHLAEIEGFRGRLDAANAHLEAAVALLGATASIDRTSDLPGVRARLLLAEGRTGEARELAAQVVADRADEADHRIRAAAMVTLAAVCDAECDSAEAVALYNRVLAMTEHDATVFHRVEAMAGRASAMLRNGDPGAAEAAAEALRTARDAGYRFLEGRALNVLAAVDLEAGRPAAAAARAREALLIHRETGHGPGEAVSLGILAECEPAGGDAS